MIEVDPIVTKVFAAHASVMSAPNRKAMNAAAGTRDKLVAKLTKEQRDAAAFLSRSVLRLVER